MLVFDLLSSHSNFSILTPILPDRNTVMYYAHISVSLLHYAVQVVWYESTDGSPYRQLEIQPTRLLANGCSCGFDAMAGGAGPATLAGRNSCKRRTLGIESHLGERSSSHYICCSGCSGNHYCREGWAVAGHLRQPACCWRTAILDRQRAARLHGAEQNPEIGSRCRTCHR